MKLCAFWRVTKELSEVQSQSTDKYLEDFLNVGWQVKITVHNVSQRHLLNILLSVEVQNIQFLHMCPTQSHDIKWNSQCQDVKSLIYSAVDAAMLPRRVDIRRVNLTID